MIGREICMELTTKTKIHISRKWYILCHEENKNIFIETIFERTHLYRSFFIVKYLIILKEPETRKTIVSWLDINTADQTWQSIYMYPFYPNSTCRIFQKIKIWPNLDSRWFKIKLTHWDLNWSKPNNNSGSN
jgi:hypothetical protein